MTRECKRCGHMTREMQEMWLHVYTCRDVVTCVHMQRCSYMCPHAERGGHMCPMQKEWWHADM